MIPPARSLPAAQSRRRLLQAALVLPPVLLAACTGAMAAPDPGTQASAPAPSAAGASRRQEQPTQEEATAVPGAEQAAPAAALPATPACADDDDVTIAQTEGPYFTRNSPERASLIQPGLAGTRLVISGRVLGTDCRPVARALLDFWQADSRGQYDNVGYRLRGHLFTDENGAYRLETVVPGLYPGRTRHIHVKAQAPNRPVLTTQLYFPSEAANRQDGIFHPDLVMDMRDAVTGAATGATGSTEKLATFDFVLQMAGWR